MTKRPPHCKNFCAGQGNQEQSAGTLRPKDNYTEVMLDNRFASKPQKIQNGDSYFFVNSRCKMRFATSGVDKAFLGSCVVDTQKFVCSGDHIDLVRFAFGTLLVKICIDRIILGDVLQNYRHHLKQSFSQ